MQEQMTVVPPKFGGGPHGIGDPEDRTLRRVEKEVLIPKIMRERARVEKCFEEVQNFEKCCKENNLLMVMVCQKENNNLKKCFGQWYENETFKNECTNLYLADRSEYRKTGLSKKYRDVAKN